MTPPVHRAKSTVACSCQHWGIPPIWRHCPGCGREHPHSAPLERTQQPHGEDS